MQSHSLLWHYLWLGSHLWLIPVVVLMFRRRLHREFPFFFAYAIEQIGSASILYALDRNPQITPVIYWHVHAVNVLISSGLRFGIIYEIYRYVLQPYTALAKLSSRVLRWSAVVLLFLAVIVSAYFPGSDLPLFAAINTLDRGVALMQAGLLSLIFFFSSYFRLSWKNYAFGIAAGLATFSAVDLARSSLRIALGPSHIFDYVAMGIFHACVLVWLAYLVAPAMAAKSLDEIPENNLHHWNNELQRFLAR